MQDNSTLLNELLDGNGFSHSFFGVEITDGYMVALPHAEFKIPLTELTPARFNAIVSLYKTIADSERLFFGAWLSNGLVYFDVSQKFILRLNAEVIGFKRKQKAIWDVKNKTEIALTT